MSIPDIINSLAGWNMPVSQEQLIRPSPDFVQTIYCACLQQITDISHESLSDQVQSAISILEDPSPVRFLLYFIRLVLNEVVRTYAHPDSHIISFSTTCA